jgi:hypothetical protein
MGLRSKKDSDSTEPLPFACLVRWNYCVLEIALELSSFYVSKDQRSWRYGRCMRRAPTTIHATLLENPSRFLIPQFYAKQFQFLRLKNGVFDSVNTE